MTESLKDTISRVGPYFECNVNPQIEAGNRISITVHSNSLRTLVRYFENMGDQEIVDVNISMGVPYVYEFDKNFTVKKKYYLGDEEVIKQNGTCCKTGESKGLKNLHVSQYMEVFTLF